MNQVALQSITKRYKVLAELGHGSMGAVYRAFDKLNAQIVALKQVLIGPSDLQFGSRTADSDVQLALVNEFRTLATLRHPFIISVLDYGFDEQKQPYFTMDMLDNAQPLHIALRSEPFETKLKVLIQILQALQYLHRRGILHRDLKPGNVLVAHGQVKVLDFGLAAASGEGQGVSGTLAYMAPEVLSGQPATEESDLYAVGMMAFELFAGSHPFNLQDIRILVNDILTTVPDVTQLNIDPRVGDVIQRLVAKQPEDRYTSAGEVISALNLEQTNSIETASTRESFLQAASFVGREAEVEKLSVALRQALNGKGTSWLIAGESGVGKSRLLDEIRTQALVSGLLVLRGQTVSEGAKAYQLWREPLRRLSLQTDLTPLQASVLKSLIPDIATLVDHDVPDAPALEPQATQDRLLSTIETLFKQQTQPMLVILEDLHWSTSENLDVLTRLNALLKDLPLVIVGSYRDDEKPGLPDRLPTMQVLKLNRLSADNIEKLGVSMLGDAGHIPTVVELLQRETEGNAFFLVDVVRALAEEAGQLDKIGTTSLPAHVVAGGVQRIIKRRLERVPVIAQPLLQLAAVSGRELDLKILHVLEPDMDMDFWLTLCSDSAVLDVHDDRWRFAHDKLREGLLNSLDGQAPQLHRKVAEAIEKVYPSAPDQAANLATHWAVAGDTAKERYYSAIAGREAASRGAHRDAIRFLERAITLYGGVASEEQIQIERMLAEAYFGLGRFDDCKQHSDRALALMGRPLPKSMGAYLGAALGEVARQTVHRFFPRTFTYKDRRPRPDLVIEECRIHNQLVAVYTFTGELLPIMYSFLHSMNLGESIKSSPSLAHVYAYASIVTTTFSMAGLARLYGKLGQEIAAKISDLSAVQLHLELMGMYQSIIGKWTEADAFFDKAVAITEKTGNRRYWAESLGLKVIFCAIRGQFAGVKEFAPQIMEDAIRNGDLNSTMNALLPIMAQQARENHVMEASDSIPTVESAIAQGVGVATDVWGYGIVAMLHARLGHYDEAQKAAENSLKAMRRSQPTASWILEGIEGALEAYLTVWQQMMIVNEKQALEKSIRRALGYMAGYARFFPIGRAQNARWQGRWKALNGNLEAAQKLWIKGLASSQALGMSYDEALLYYEIGTHLEPTDPARDENLRRAGKIFGEIGALYEFDQAQTALQAQKASV